MQMTPELKLIVDTASYLDLLRIWRFAPIGDDITEGESGKYISQRMIAMRAEPGGNDLHCRCSRALGWTRVSFSTH